MATRLYGISRGENYGSVVTEGVGSATAADNIELTVDLAVSLTKAEVVMALQRIADYITTHDWPPA